MTSPSQFSMDFTAGLAPRESFSLAKIQVAPLIDTVLFLIWFYLMVGQLVMHQKDATIDLPAMSNSLAAKELPAEVVLNLRQDGTVTVEGQKVGTAQISALLAREQAKAAAENRGLRVVVRADRKQNVGALEDILQSCRRCGLGEVVLRAKEAGGL